MTKVSVCCVTNRPEFRDWLMWNYEKQFLSDGRTVLEHARAGHNSDESELIIVNNPKTIADGRNAALQRARGDVVTFFDDDDWQYPDRLQIASKATDNCVGSRNALMVDVYTGGFIKRRAGWILHFNSFAAPTRIARQIQFEDGAGEDVKWTGEVQRACDAEFQIDALDTTINLHWWMCHERNTVNTRDRYRFEQSDEFHIDGPTIEALEALRQKLNPGETTLGLEESQNDARTDTTISP